MIKIFFMFLSIQSLTCCCVDYLRSTSRSVEQYLQLWLKLRVLYLKMFKHRDRWDYICSGLWQEGVKKEKKNPLYVKTTAACLTSAAINWQPSMWRAAIFHPRGSAQRGRRRRDRRKSSSEAEEWVSAGYKTKSRDWPRYEESGRDSCGPIRENPAALQLSHQTCTHKLSAVFMVNIVYLLTESSALSQCAFKYVQTFHFQPVRTPRTS